MNERIKELIERATEPPAFPGDIGYFNRQKFAELIVRECLSMIHNAASQYAEPVWAFELVNDIKEHFGVEE